MEANGDPSSSEIPDEQTALKHIEPLAGTIGPRGSTSAAELAGHDYVRQQLEEIGCATQVESFTVAKSAFPLYVLAFALVLGAEAGFWFAPAASGLVLVAVVALITVVSLLLEMLGMANPFRRLLPRDPSQNVIGVTRAAGEVRRRVALMAHVDTQHTPWIWWSPLQISSSANLFRSPSLAASPAITNDAATVG